MRKSGTRRIDKKGNLTGSKEYLGKVEGKEEEYGYRYGLAAFVCSAHLR